MMRVAFAARILQDQLSIFVNFEEPQREVKKTPFRNLPSTRRF
jgi:DNA-directed RNA polymerase subunit alpha